MRQTRVRQWWWDKRTVVRSREFVMKRWKKQVSGTIGKSMEIYNMIEKAKEWAGKLEWMAMVDGELEAEHSCLIWEVLTRCSPLRDMAIKAAIAKLLGFPFYPL